MYDFFINQITQRSVSYSNLLQYIRYILIVLLGLSHQQALVNFFFENKLHVETYIVTKCSQRRNTWSFR